MRGKNSGAQPAPLSAEGKYQHRTLKCSDTCFEL